MTTATASRLGPADTIAAAKIATCLRVFFEPGDVVELRAVEVRRKQHERPHVESGFFDYDHFEQMASLALEVERYAVGVYYTLNPLVPEIIYRRFNRIDWAETGKLANDQHVRRRRWLLIDADPVRIAGIPSTDEEKAESSRVVQAVRSYLTDEEWPKPIVADSANGYHLLYPIDLPADDGGLVERLLNKLADQFDTDAVKIDRTVHNPARITKLYGTVGRKGDDVPGHGRPHRRSSILVIPEGVEE